MLNLYIILRIVPHLVSAGLASNPWTELESLERDWLLVDHDTGVSATAEGHISPEDAEAAALAESSKSWVAIPLFTEMASREISPLIAMSPGDLPPRFNASVPLPDQLGWSAVVGSLGDTGSESGDNWPIRKRIRIDDTVDLVDEVPSTPSSIESSDRPWIIGLDHPLPGSDNDDDELFGVDDFLAEGKRGETPDHSVGSLVSANPPTPIVGEELTTGSNTSAWMSLLSRGMGPADMAACFEDLIANPGDTRARHTNRMRERLPDVPEHFIRDHWDTLMLHTTVPVWLHELLLARRPVQEAEYVEVIKRASKMAEVNNYRGIPQMDIAVRTWMRFCINPLIAHRGPAVEIVTRMFPRFEMRLSAQQQKLFFIDEYAKLIASVGPERMYRAALASAARAMRHRGPAVPVRTGMRPIKTNHLIACLSVLAEDPVLDAAEFDARVRALKPSASEGILSVRDSLISRSHIPKWAHDFLLARGDPAGTPATTTALMREAKRLNKQLTDSVNRTVKTWTKYCIGPALANRGSIHGFCRVHAADDTEEVYLVLAQRRALIRDLITSASSSRRLTWDLRQLD